MPALFIYLIKVNVALLIFCAGYYAVLRHLTFYNLNRIYLVTAILFSTLYPKLNVSEFLNRHEQIARPIQVVVVNWQEPVKTIANTFAGHDQWYWLQAAFWLGVCVFGVRLSIQLLSLYRLHKRSEPAQLHHYMIRVIKGDLNPFSFWKSIYINPDNHPPHELSAILEHEQIHVDEWHTLDILLGEISAIFYWFNPGIWLMKRAIRENIEFITDQRILQKGVDSKTYQYSLLNVNFGAQHNPIVNHFNISTIKKRIMMMNAKRSSKVNITRYLFLIPAVMVLLLIFSVSKAELKKAVNTGTNIITDLKTDIVKITLKTIEPVMPKHEKAPRLQAVSIFTIQADTIKKGEAVRLTGKAVTDTSKGIAKFMRVLVDDNMNNIWDGGRGISYSYVITSDTDKTKKIVLKPGVNASKAVIYVNGVRVDGLESVSPDNIADITVKKSSNDLPDGAIYITTNGKFDPAKTLNIKNVGDSIYIVNGKGLSHVAIAASRMGTSASGKTYTITTGTNIKKLMLNGHVVDPKDVQINGLSMKDDTINTTIITRTIPGVLVRKDTLLNNVSGAVVVNGLQRNNSARTLTSIRLNGKTVAGQALTIKPAPISFANKLIIIDGKEATEKQLKKVSADRIDSISNLSYEAARALYGDKAKNGVVVITTKK